MVFKALITDLTRLNDGGICAQGYVDDICLLAVGNFPNTVSGLMQSALHSVEGRCDEHGLSVIPDKTGLVTFTQKRKLPGFFDPRLFEVTLQRSRSTKYLGLILDARLTWKKHIEDKGRKASNMMWACRRACGRRWGLRPRVVHWHFTSIVRPSITYASLVWWPGCETARAKQTLGTIQRLACLRIKKRCVQHLPIQWRLSWVSFHWIWWFRVRLGPQRIVSGAWGVGLTFIPIAVQVEYWCGFSNRTPYLI
jgi:hypothetical protein